MSEARKAFESHVNQYDTFGDEWQDKGVDEHFIAGYEAGKAARAGQESEPFAFCFTDVNGKPSEFCDHPKHAAEGDTRIRTPLYTHPASAKKEIERLQARVAELCDLIKYAQVKSGACMCGDNMQDHNQASGHSPVDMWDHAVEQVDKSGTSEALILRKQAEAVQASREAASVPEWIKCSDRLPAEYDGDFEGLVWVNDRDMLSPVYAQPRVHWSRVRGIAAYTHWMPTGFRRPQPPIKGSPV
jgi:hypothetical protein